jgi:hypothetical protein
MIAMLLAAQITAAALPQGLPLEAVPPPRGYIAPMGGLIRGLPAKNCPGSGRMEASFRRPIALYRSGDRPAKPLLRWADYPDPRICAVEVAP